MFKRQLELKVVKTPKSPITTMFESEPNTTASDLIAKISRKDVVQAAAGTFAVYAGVVAVKTLSTIAINAAPKR